MMLEAVWFKDGKEVFWADPVLNLVCDENMKTISEIEVYNGVFWYGHDDADDFVIRIKKDKD